MPFTHAVGVTLWARAIHYGLTFVMLSGQIGIITIGQNILREVFGTGVMAQFGASVLKVREPENSVREPMPPEATEAAISYRIEGPPCRPS